jgi:trans-AT polyketide synthase/acyltransferase/oxidoreductase domain-containing protein
MGAEVFDLFPDLVEQADAELGYSIRRLCLEDPDKQLDQTQFTQPALFIVCALTYLDLEKKAGGIIPDFAAGHSVGEYAALFAAGVFDFITGVRLTRKRGELMSREAGGAMAAVIGLPVPRIQELLRNCAFDAIDIANFNSPEQTVISGPPDEIAEASEILQESGARMVVRLKVSAAFHSRAMRKPSREFAEYLRTQDFQAPRFPVISNLEAKPYDGPRAKQILADQICNPVLWHDSMRYLLTQGAMAFQEIGPGKVLTQLLSQIQKG